MDKILLIMSKFWTLLSAIWLSIGIILIFKGDVASSISCIIMVLVCSIMKKILKINLDKM